MSLVSLPQELYPKIFFNLNFKALCQLPFVSKGLKDLFSNEEFWRNSFFYKFPKETLSPNEQAKKQFLARISPILVTDYEQLRKVVTSFFCNLKWNKKRELICTFHNEPTYFLKLSQSFGPDRGTKEGSNGNADETEYYKSLTPASDKTSNTVNFADEKFTQCPGTSYDRILDNGPDPLDKNGVPLSITSTLVCRPSFWPPGPEIDIPRNYVNGKITDVDVGFGNTLGYFSEINDWKHPFKLFCITDSDSNKPVWVGLIPLNVEFKFISIDSNGAVTWEHNTGNQRSENRVIAPHRGYDRSGLSTLANNLRNHPVRFS